MTMCLLKLLQFDIERVPSRVNGTMHRIRETDLDELLDLRRGDLWIRVIGLDLLPMLSLL